MKLCVTGEQHKDFLEVNKSEKRPRKQITEAPKLVVLRIFDFSPQICDSDDYLQVDLRLPSVFCCARDQSHDSLPLLLFQHLKENNVRGQR